MRKNKVTKVKCTKNNRKGNTRNFEMGLSTKQISAVNYYQRDCELSIIQFWFAFKDENGL